MMHGSDSEPIQFQRFSRRVRKAKLMLNHAAQGDRWPNDGNLSKLVTRIAMKRLAHVSLHGMLGNRAAGIRRVLKDTNRREACDRAGSEQFVYGYALKDSGEMPDLRRVCIGHRDEKQAHSARPFFELRQ
jgi:hypothetical protein